MRDDDLIKLRVELDLETAKSEEEQFQNEVLRPIIKYQALVIANIYKSYLIKNKVPLNQLSITDYNRRIRTDLIGNKVLSTLLIGAIVGLLTIDELNFYLDNNKDVNKRIISMVSQRLKDQFYLVFP